MNLFFQKRLFPILLTLTSGLFFSNTLFATDNPVLKAFTFRHPNVPNGCILTSFPDFNGAPETNPYYLPKQERDEEVKYLFKKVVEPSNIREILAGIYLSKGWEQGKDNASYFEAILFDNETSVSKALEEINAHLKKMGKDKAKDFYVKTFKNVLIFIEYRREPGPGTDFTECFESLQNSVEKAIQNPTSQPSKNSQ